MQVNQINGFILLDDLKYYIYPDYFNRVIYHQRSTNADECMNQLLVDVDKLLSLCKMDYNGSTEYDLFVRCLSEQTIVKSEKHRLHTKEDDGIKSFMPQNPSEPKATFQSKTGKKYRRYVANLEEFVGTNGSIATEYQYKQSNHSNSLFIQERLGQIDRTYRRTKDAQFVANKNGKQPQISLLILNPTKGEQKSFDVQSAIHQKTVLI